MLKGQKKKTLKKLDKGNMGNIFKYQLQYEQEHLY